jgi:hypothetical protein
MGASSREFMLMRMEEESGQMYVPSIPKKEIVQKAKDDVKSMVDSGEVDIAEAVIDATRLSEYLKVFVSELRNHVGDKYDKYECKGVKLSFKGTGDRLDYEQDEKYAELKDALKQREELLKLAYKSKDMLFDSEGIEVPKVGVKTPSKQTLNINF